MSDLVASETAWHGSLPSGWSSKVMRRVVRPVSERATERTRAIALENIEPWTGKMVESETEFEGIGTAFKQGDILYGKLRPYLAKVLVPEFDGEAVGDFHVLRQFDGDDAKYLQYLLLSEQVVATLNGSTYGSKMPRVDWEFMAGLRLPIPDDVALQTAIAAFLDNETAKIDDLVAEQKRLIELLKEKRQAVVTQAVTRGLNPDAPMKDSGVEWLGKVPVHWKVMRLGRLFSERNDPGEEGLPFLSVSIHDGVSDREYAEHELDRKIVRGEDPEAYKAVHVGDLVYNMMRAWQGGFGSVETAGMVSPAYVVATPNSGVMTPFVEKLLRTSNAIMEMKRVSKGVTDFRLRLYWDEFKAISVAMPEPIEQRAILEMVSQVEKQMRELIDNSQSCIDLLQERRSALISAAVTGKIDVRDHVTKALEAA